MELIIIKKEGLKKKVAPIYLRKKMLDRAHGKFGPPGIQKKVKYYFPNYYEPNITQDINRYVTLCDIWRKTKI